MSTAMTKKATGTAIAPRYQLFISLLEKKISRAQQEIEEMNQLETIYNIARKGLEQWGIDRAVETDLGKLNVHIHMSALETDSITIFDDLASIISTELFQKHLRDDDTYASNKSHIYSFYEEGIYVYYTINCKSDSFREVRDSMIRITVKIPSTGLIDMKVVKHVAAVPASTMTTYYLRPLDYKENT